MCHDILGVLLEKGLQRADGVVVAFRLGVDHAQVEIGVLILGVEGDDSPVRRDSLFVVLLEQVDTSDEAICFHVVGVIDEGLLADGKCLVQLPHFYIKGSQFRGEESRLRVECECFFVFLCGLGQIAVEGKLGAE